VWKFHDELSTIVIAEEEQDYDTGIYMMDDMLEAMQAEVSGSCTPGTANH
jgi:hypothetical protein